VRNMNILKRLILWYKTPRAGEKLEKWDLVYLGEDYKYYKVKCEERGHIV